MEENGKKEYWTPGKKDVEDMFGWKEMFDIYIY